MESAGFVKRIVRRHRNGGNKTNRYSFDGLIREAEPFAQEALKERERRKHEKSASDTRRGRHLRAVRAARVCLNGRAGIGTGRERLSMMEPTNPDFQSCPAILDG